MTAAREEELAKEAIKAFAEQEAAAQAAEAQRLKEEAKLKAEMEAKQAETAATAATELLAREGNMNTLKEKIAYWEGQLDVVTTDEEYDEIWETLADLEYEYFGYEMEAMEQQEYIDAMNAEVKAAEEEAKKLKEIEEGKARDLSETQTNRLATLKTEMAEATAAIDLIY